MTDPVVLQDPINPFLRHYIVTLKNFDDLDAFYHDMEDPSNNNFTPDRAVALMDRREISRNTQYMLTDQEAEQLRQDPRVESVMLHPEILGISDNLFWAQQDTTEETFDKTSTTLPTIACNWALYRCTQSNNPVVNGKPWGEGGTAVIRSKLQLQPTGKNVDVVLVDYGVPDPLHPEYAVNADGTGGTRLKYANWTARTGINYPTTPTNGLAAESWHSWHVAGTVAGNRQGWARDANLYVASLGFNSNIFDYVREWHLSKPVNIETGRRNPTIINMSIGSSISYSVPGSGASGWNRNNISRIFYRGQFYYPPFTDQQLIDFGMVPGKPWPVIIASWAADVQDAIDNGIILVAAAGNENWRLDDPSGPDWNNFATYYGYDFYISRGCTPARIGSSGIAQPICVAALGSDANETRAYFSNYGPGIDVFAPGTNIVSSVPRIKGYADPRDTNYGIAYSQGTSMATPQVTGILACMLEDHPTWTQSQARSWLLENSKTNQITEITTQGTYYQLSGSPNKLAYFPNEWTEQIPVANVSLVLNSSYVIENSVSPLIWTFTRDGDISSNLSVNYTVSGSALLNYDYTTTAFNSVSGIQTITIPQGSNSATVSILPKTDGLTEGNETISLQLSSGNGYAITTTVPVVGTIIDYVTVKPRVTLSVSPKTVTESSRTGITWTFSRSPVNSSNVTVYFNVAGTATYGADYVSNQVSGSGVNTLTIPAYTARAIVNIKPIVDNALEPIETVSLALLEGPEYIAASTAPITATITNTYVPLPAIKITVSPSVVMENGNRNIVFTVGRTGQTSLPLTVNYVVSGTASAGVDYVGVSAGPSIVTIPAGRSSTTITVVPINDKIKENRETVTISLSRGNGYIVGSPGYASAVIVSDD